MATPQETRFLRLAMQTKVLTRDQLKACLEYQEQKQKEGSKIPVWDCTVLTSMLDQNVAEKLQNLAGDLNIDKLGEFTVVRKLGEGGMGSVWMGAGPDKQKVAVKVLSRELAKQRSFLTRFFREAQASIKLQHKNIVRGLAVGEDRGHYYFAMEFVQGKTVGDMLEQGGAMAPEEATDIILQIAEALAYAHANNLVHRDIKPDNIMVTKDGVAKLADLGLARQVDAEMTALTRTGTSMGTPHYMAPEQVTDAKRADARADIYSLGATWYHMVTGEFPFSGDSVLEIYQKHLKEPVKSPQSVRPGLPRGISLTIERMMAKEPDRRIQTVQDLCQVIRDECMGDRDVVKELGLQERTSSRDMWEMKVVVGKRAERRRMSIGDIRERINKGQVTKETPARRVGSRGDWQPAGSYKELAPEFPKDFAKHVTTPKPEERGARAELHQMLTQFDKASRSYGRKKKFRKLLPYLIEGGIILILVIVGIIFRAQIWDFVSGLLGGSAEAPTAP